MASRVIVVKTSLIRGEAGATDASNRWIFEMRAFSIANARMSQLSEVLALVAPSQNTD
jgi:hypothetical protein